MVGELVMYKHQQLLLAIGIHGQQAVLGYTGQGLMRLFRLRFGGLCGRRFGALEPEYLARFVAD